MPIVGLTDRGAALPQIGTLRKGAPKPDRGIGRELPYWRFTSDDATVVQAFADAFGPTPTEIEVMLVGATVDETFDAWNEAYTTGALAHRCDGESVVLQLAPDKKSYYRWRQGEGPPCPGGCKSVGRLKVIVPKLARAGIVVVQTTSKHDLLALSGCLAFCEQMSRMQTEDRLPDLRRILFVLSRYKRNISTPVLNREGNRQRVDKWLVGLQPHPTWMGHQLSARQSAALAALPEAIHRRLDQAVEEAGLDEDGEYADDDGFEPEDPPRTPRRSRVVVDAARAVAAHVSADAVATSDPAPGTLAPDPEAGRVAAAREEALAAGVDPDEVDAAHPDDDGTHPAAAVAGAATSVPAPPPPAGPPDPTPAAGTVPQAAPPPARNGRAPIDPAKVRARLEELVGESMTYNEVLGLDIPIVDQPAPGAAATAMIEMGRRQSEYAEHALETRFDELVLDAQALPRLLSSSGPDEHRAYRVALARMIGETTGVDFDRSPRVVIER